MNDRQKKLVREYGPRFIARQRQILDDVLYLSADAISVFTDEEWKSCAEAMIKFVDELTKLKTIAEDRVNETLEDGEQLIDLYIKAKEDLKRFRS